MKPISLISSLSRRGFAKIASMMLCSLVMIGLMPSWALAADGWSADGALAGTLDEDDPIVLTVYTQADTVSDREVVKTYTKSELEDIATKGEKKAMGQWRKTASWTVMASDDYVTIEDLLVSADIDTFKEGSYIIFSVGKGGFSSTFTYDQATSGLWYGTADNATTADQLTGGTDLDLALCITWDTASVGEAETCDDAVANITPYDSGSLRNGVGIYDLSAVGGNRSCKSVSEITIIAQKVSFPDVPTSGAWYSDVVYKAVAAGIFSGYDDGNFGPNNYMNRAQLAVALWNYYGNPKPSGTATLADIEEGKYYTDAAKWAVENGIINGYGQSDGTCLFKPSGALDRDQACTIIANAATKFAGAQVDGRAATSTAFAAMPDKDSVDSWAADSVAWCLDENVMSGSERDGKRYIDPRVRVTRAQACAFIMNADSTHLLRPRT